MEPWDESLRQIPVNALFRLAHMTGAANRLELIAEGYSDRDIRTAVDTGLLVSLGRGVVVPHTLVDDTREVRHRELARAWIRRDQRTADTRARSDAIRALAGPSASAALGLPVWGLDTSRVTVLDTGRSPGTRTTRNTHLVTDRRAPSIIDVDGVLVTSPARTVVDLARTAARIPAIAVGDAALHAKLCSPDDLANELDLIDGMTGCREARRVVAEMNGLAESVLESRSRIELVDAGLPMPKLQVIIYDSRGRIIARVDLYWEDDRLCGEADGDLKYDGPNGRQALRDEKARADAILDTDRRLVRWGWKDLDPIEQLVERVSAARKRSGARRNPPHTSHST